MVIRRHFSSLSEEELTQYLEQGPNDRVAFLSGGVNRRAIAETLAALANANGGVVLLGVTAKGVPQTIANLTTLRELVLEATLLTEPPLILPTPQIVTSSRGDVVVVQVPPGLPHIYGLQGQYLTRSGGQNRPLPPAELRRLLLERDDTGFERQPLPAATLADFEAQTLERYLDRIAVPPDEEPVQTLLARGCVIDNGGQLTPTVAGILLFGRNPQRFLRSAEIICVRYMGEQMDDEFVRQDITGTLAEQIRQAEAFVTSNMRRGMKLNRLAREETTEYPIPVIREAIVNAVAHRDYSVRGEGIRLVMYHDRLEIYSPGRLPGHVTLDNLKDERFSRNEAIVAVLSDLGYIERLGYGIDRMIGAMQAAGLPAPLFAETTAGFKVTLSASVPLPTAPLAGGVQSGRTLATPPPPPERLNERQEQALLYVQQHGRITNSDLQEMVPDVSPETIRRDLADLVERNLLIRIGAKKATYYILK